MNKNLFYIPVALMLIIQMIGIYEDDPDRLNLYLYFQIALLVITIIMAIYVTLAKKKK